MMQLAPGNTYANFCEFRRYIKALYSQADYNDITWKIWLDYWSGIRDSRLSDNAIWLIDRFGY